MKRSGRSSLSIVGSVIALALKLLFWALVIALPLTGAWIGSSLAAYQNGPTWVPIAAAALAFPVLPLAWEAFAQWRSARARSKLVEKERRIEARTGQKLKLERERVLTLADRLILRTLAVNLVFLGVLFVRFPSDVFTALSARGDWFLDQSTASWAPAARTRLFAAADRLEWLWELTHDNPFADDAPTPSPSASAEPTPTPPPVPEPTAQVEPKPEQPERPPTDDKPPPEPAPAKGFEWPFEPRLHPAVVSLPPAAEASIESVGRHLAREVKDPHQLVKALHDYVADRIEYDVPSYLARNIPPQNAEAVFAARKGVCAGYSLLLRALGKAAGVDFIYVVGQSRSDGGDVDGQGHAWNAVRIGGQWYLVDATWDAGYLDGDRFAKQYSSDYLLTPPKVFGLNHLPEDDKWQLRDKPMSRGEFIRQPNVRPMLYAKGFELVAPLRSQVTVDKGLTVELTNKRDKPLLVSWERKGDPSPLLNPCDLQTGPLTRASCTFDGAGTFHVNVSVGEPGENLYWRAAQFEVNRR